MSTWTLNGDRVVSGSMTIPTWGAWAADVVLSDAQSLPTTPLGAQMLIGKAAQGGTVFRTGPFAGSRSARIVGGYAGWRQKIPARGYSRPAGVRMSLVLADAARDCGEKLVFGNSPDRIVGKHWAREEAKAEETLDLLVDGQWWIAPDGSTQLGPRPSTPIASPFTVIAWSGGKGQFEIATENVEDWLPGRTFKSPTVPTVQTISSVTIDVDNEGVLRLQVLNTEGALERLRSDMRSIVRASIGPLAFFGMWEYKIASGDLDAADVTPLDKRMPPITKCPMRPGLMGEKVRPSSGSMCRVMFVNGDPGRPEIVGIIGSPERIEIADPIPTQASARFGDAATSTAVAGGSTKVFIGG